jgi:hypothetical protein
MQRPKLIACAPEAVRERVEPAELGRIGIAVVRLTRVRTYGATPA